MRMTLLVGVVGLAVATVGCSGTTPASGATVQSTTSATPTIAVPSVTVTAGGASPAATSAGAASRSPTPSVTATVAPSPAPFVLSSTAFKDGGAIPSTATCDGAGRSPELAWSGAPRGTQALALIVTDPDANDFVHWLAFDMTGAPDGRLAAGIAATADPPRQGANDFDRRGYGGPCPPSGEHHYRFDLYALDRPLGIDGTPRIAAIRTAMQGHVLAQARLTGTYRRH